MAAIYAVYTSPNHPPIPNHLPTLIITPHGQPTNILYSYLHTNYASPFSLFPPPLTLPRTQKTTSSLPPPRAISASQSFSLHVVRTARAQHQIQAMPQAQPPASSAVRPLATSNGP